MMVIHILLFTPKFYNTIHQLNSNLPVM